MHRPQQRKQGLIPALEKRGRRSSGRVLRPDGAASSRTVTRSSAAGGRTPRQALVEEARVQAVLDRFGRRPVQAGGRFGEEVEESAGLVGEAVVGAQRLGDGGAVAAPGREVGGHREDGVRRCRVEGQPGDVGGISLAARQRVVRRSALPVHAAGRREGVQSRRRQLLALGQGGEVRGGPRLVRGAVRQVPKRAAVGGDHPALFQGERGQGVPVGLTAGDQWYERIGPGVRGQFPRDRLQQFPGRARHRGLRRVGRPVRGTTGFPTMVPRDPGGRHPRGPGGAADRRRGSTPAACRSPPQLLAAPSGWACRTGCGR